MRLSTRTRYGVRALGELARAYPRRVMSVRTLARRQRLSVKYLERIMSVLKTAGLVEAVRGAEGGYRLAAPPGSIRLSDVFRALDGGLVLVECLERPTLCSMSRRCITRRTWKTLNDALAKVLKATTLRDLGRRPCAARRATASAYEI